MSMVLTPTHVRQRRSAQMKVRPRVSAILTILNAEKHLAKSIESVLSQSYHDWELLLCDDGSADGSCDIARRYAQWYPCKVKYLQHPNRENRGINATRNLGLAHASGQYVAWLDADDVWQQHKLEQQVTLLDQHREAAMVYCPQTLWHRRKDGRGDAGRDGARGLGAPDGRLLQPRELLIHALEDDCCLPAGPLVRKLVLEEVGGFDESFRNAFADAIIHAKVNMHRPVLAVSEAWCQRRQHEAAHGRASRSASENRRHRLAYLKYLLQYVRDEGIDDEMLWQAIEDQMQANQVRLRQLLLARCQQVFHRITACMHAKLTYAHLVMPPLFPTRRPRSVRQSVWCQQVNLSSQWSQVR